MPRYRTRLKPKTQPKQSQLPLWLALIGAALVLFAGWAILNNSAQTKANVEVKGAPRLKVEKDTIDHGNVTLGTPIQDDVRVTNVGDQPLTFSVAPYVEIKEGC